MLANLGIKMSFVLVNFGSQLFCKLFCLVFRQKGQTRRRRIELQPLLPSPLGRGAAASLRRKCRICRLNPPEHVRRRVKLCKVRSFLHITHMRVRLHFIVLYRGLVEVANAHKSGFFSKAQLFYIANFYLTEITEQGTH